MTDKEERKAAARKAKIQMRDIKRGMTPEELEAFRAKEKEMKKDQPSRLDRPKIKVISPEERAERREAAKKRQDKRRRAEQFESPSERQLESGERKAARAAQKFAEEKEDNNFMAAYGKASGGMTKKYGYMGGGKVYGQPRKANYKAG